MYRTGSAGQACYVYWRAGRRHRVDQIDFLGFVALKALAMAEIQVSFFVLSFFIRYSLPVPIRPRKSAPRPKRYKSEKVISRQIIQIPSSFVL